MTRATVRPLGRRERSTTVRVTLDLMHIAAGRPDLSRNPSDHDEWCARTIDEEARCTCRKSPLCEDGR